MKTAKAMPTLERLVGPLGECLTPESARRVLALRADPALQARVDYLAGRCNEGRLSPEERAEYGNYIIGLLKEPGFLGGRKPSRLRVLAMSSALRPESRNSTMRVMSGSKSRSCAYVFTGRINS